MFLILLLIAVCSSGAFEPQNCGLPRGKQYAGIIGGKAVTTDQFPWIVGGKSPVRKGGTGCTGTLISERHVLMAAHCFKSYIRGESELSPNWIICLGIDELKPELCSPNMTYEIEKLNFYEEYLTKGNQYDIVVLTLSREVENAVPVCLPIKKNGELRYNGTNPTNLYSAGYSRNNPYENNNKLKMANKGLPVPCSPVGRMCTNQSEKASSCPGDSGGPLIEIHEGRHVIVGVHSGSNAGVCYGKPGNTTSGGYAFAVEVALHMDFIQSAMTSTEKVSSTPSISTTEVPTLVSSTETKVPDSTISNTETGPPSTVQMTLTTSDPLVAVPFLP